MASSVDSFKAVWTWFAEFLNFEFSRLGPIGYQLALDLTNQGQILSQSTQIASG